MPRLSEAMKGAVSCEKLRIGANDRSTRRCPNGETRLTEGQAFRIDFRKANPGTETSKYPEERKTTVMPQVVASERGTAQTPMRGIGG